MKVLLVKELHVLAIPIRAQDMAFAEASSK